MLKEVSPEELDALPLTREEYRAWKEEWEQDCAASTWPLNVYAHKRDFNYRILQRRTDEDTKRLAREQKPLRDRVELTYNEGIQTLFYPHRPLAERMIHGVVSTPSINSKGTSYASRGCRAKFPLPVFCSHAKEGDPIGEVVSLRLSQGEIYIRAEIFKSSAADYAWELIKSGELQCLSAGSTQHKVQGVVEGIKFISSWRLREVSICRKGANPDARFEVLGALHDRRWK
jgi:hypothetical protein